MSGSEAILYRWEAVHRRRRRRGSLHPACPLQRARNAYKFEPMGEGRLPARCSMPESPKAPRRGRWSDERAQGRRPS